MIEINSNANIDEIRERRLSACIKMVEDAYQVDGYGVAELIGMDKRTWTRYKRLPWGKKGANLIMGLCQLTGVRPSWLCAEDVEPLIIK